jgi:mono/diheme cytochrome c family protein
MMRHRGFVARHRRAVVLLPLVLLLVPCSPLPAAEAGPEATKFFEERVRPVLANHCQPCHDAARHKGGLRLDSRTALLQGGDSGPAIKPGQPEESLLIRAIRHGEQLRMPPKKKLSQREITDLTAWVRHGAPWPDTSATVRPGARPEAPSLTEEERSFWAFRPAVEPPLPAVKDGSWPRTSLDLFVLAKLEEAGLRPAPPADRRTLLRRATFDLTGLPPTPEETKQFLADSSPDAYEKVVDRLLASPAYGERLGRHWLDVARYADSNGMDENLAHANAWRYRDYVVAAFNQDMPYDQFVVEQLAGDLLPPDSESINRRRVIATGFLSLGPKMLAEDDPVKMEMDIIDEQIDTLGRTFLGLTFGCARCHDHKFDPLSMADYYGLAGIFKSTKTMDNFRVVARWHERDIASREEAEAVREYEKLRAERVAAIERLKPREKDHGAELMRLRRELAELDRTRPVPPRAMAVSEGSVANVRIHLRGSHWTLGKEVPRRFPEVLAGAGQMPLDGKQSGRLQLARWLTRPDNPLTARVMVNRIWHWHFGQGLVRSTDNFGRLGDRPINQPLFDWLARRFIQSGWSVKATHRLIMLSSTYRMSTAYDARAALADPDNRRHWRTNRRRLEAEEVRDAILAISGRLDRAVGGSLLKSKDFEYVASTFSVNPTNYSSDRRSLYLPVIRSALYETFQAFDFPDPSVPAGERASTTIASQALFMMNSPIVLEQTRRFAADLLSRANLDDRGRVRLAYERAYSRPPSAAETARALSFVRRIEDDFARQKLPPAEQRLRAWQSLCRVVLSANEFLYLE